MALGVFELGNGDACQLAGDAEYYNCRRCPVRSVHRSLALALRSCAGRFARKLAPQRKTPPAFTGGALHLYARTGRAGLMPDPRAGRACEQVCERGAQLQLFGEPSSRKAFRNACGISFPGRGLHAAFSSSAREGLVRHCCREQRSVRWFNLHLLTRFDHANRAIVWRVRYL